MQTTNSLEFIDLILNDIKAESNLAITKLEAYSKSNHKDKTELDGAMEHIKVLRGVYIILEMKGGQRLTSDVIAILKRMSNITNRLKPQILETVMIAMIRLIKYTRYISHKPADLPQLLLTAINELRACVNVHPLPESFFFRKSARKARLGKNVSFLINDECAAKSRHYRQMYQIGLIEVLKNTNVVGGLKMMQNAISKLDNECSRPQSPNFWWIAEALFDSLISGGTKLTGGRVGLLSRIDRQIRNLATAPREPAEEVKTEINELTKELLYITSISDNKTELVHQVLEHFELTVSNITDKLLQKEAVAFNRPSDQDFSSLADALLKEIEFIESSLLVFHRNKYSSSDIIEIKKKIVTLSNLLKILQIDEHVISLTICIDLIDRSLGRKKRLLKKELDTLVNIILKVKKTVKQGDLVRQITQSTENHEPLNTVKIESRDRAQLLINRLINDVTKFTTSHRSVSILKNTPAVLIKLKKEFNVLEVEGSDNIIQNCLKFIKFHLMRAPSNTSDDAIILFADVIGSLEFYLETLKFTVSPSPRILQFAENSLTLLNKLMDSKKRKR